MIRREASIGKMMPAALWAIRGGAGVPKDIEKARTLYRMAATLGDQVGKQAVARLR